MKERNIVGLIDEQPVYGEIGAGGLEFFVNYHLPNEEYPDVIPTLCVVNHPIGCSNIATMYLGEAIDHKVVREQFMQSNSVLASWAREWHRIAYEAFISKYPDGIKDLDAYTKDSIASFGFHIALANKVKKEKGDNDGSKR